MNKNIHLINIAAPYRGVEDRSTPPFGCLYVGGQLKASGFDVTVHHITSKEIQSTCEAIISSKPLLVGFSILTGSPVSSSAVCSNILKEQYPDTAIVWGGVHPSLTPETCLVEDSVDFVVRGEGEITAVELAKALTRGTNDFSKINGLSWKNDNGELIHNQDRAMEQDIDCFKIDWSLVDPTRYIKTALDGSPYMSFITSRGCPFKCGFCYNQQFNKRRWRGHSQERVLQDLKELRDLTGVSKVTFYDDNFLVNEKRAFTIFNGMKDLGMTASFIEIRLDRFTDKLLSQLKEYSVRTLFVGWESGCNSTLENIDKGFNRTMVLEAFKLAAQHNMEIDGSAIVGFPFETSEDWLQTITTVSEIDRIHPGMVKFNIGVYVPYPGTPLLKQAIEKGFSFPENIADWEKFDILTGEMRLPWLTPEQIKTIMLADRYAKMLFIGGGSKSLVLAVRKFFAVLARRRLSRYSFTFPWEAWLYNFAVKLYVKSKNV